MTWQSRLLSWYRKHRRDLPWRRTRDPYKIWVSEIMLQQTTVETVIPYYEKFLKRFPTIRLLAGADEDEVLREWSGLGYYSRARNLHRAARIIIERSGPVAAIRSHWQSQMLALFGGDTALPRRPPSVNLISLLQKLPGIGRYTAGAIASIAFGVRAPILDGNVIRVLSRLFAIRKDPKSSQGQKIFWKKAEGVLPKKHCGDFNQALMELGATVCLPENPICPLCPAAGSCRAHQEGNPEKYPQGLRKKIYHEERLTAAVIEEKGRLLMRRRPDQGLLRRLWEFPMVQGDIQRLEREFSVQPLRLLPVVRHSVLQKRLKIQPVVCALKRRDFLRQIGESIWIKPQEIQQFPTSSMNRKVLATFLSPNR